MFSLEDRWMFQGIDFEILYFISQVPGEEAHDENQLAAVTTEEATKLNS